LENAAKQYTAKKSSETSPRRASRLKKDRNNQSIKHYFESPESQNHRLQDKIKRKSLTNANENVDQPNERLKTHRETQQLIRADVHKTSIEIFMFSAVEGFRRESRTNTKKVIVNKHR
jgi:hypothetical protein